tara:strand:- start:1813 stop:2112 length:300 start_codon:yes stop_codon:yes gene_type:complete
MNRYKNTKITVGKSKKVLKTTILPNIPTDISDIIIISKVGDRLDLLANQHYGNKNMWWLIAEANGLGKGSLYVPTGMQIRIPKDLSKIEERMEKISKGR